MDFFVLLIVAYGIQFGLANDKTPISQWLRERKFGTDAEGHTFFTRLLSCPFCLGFHAGYAAWLLTHLPLYVVGAFSFTGAVPFEVVTAALAGAASCYLIDTFAQWLEDSSAAARAGLDE